MKQLLQSYRTGELRVEEAPVPALRPAGVLVRNAFSLISPGTERSNLELARAGLLEKARRRPDQLKQVFRSARQEGWLATYRKVMDRLDTPATVGYCSAGVILEAGADAAEFKPGDRVACAGEGFGAHAEVVYCPRTMCARVPDGVPLDHAAFAPLGAIALESLRQAKVELGERVAVVGLGLVGLLIVQLLEAAGCHVLATDLDTDRAELARRFGAETVADPEHAEAAAAAFSHGRGVDAVILAAGARSPAPLELAGRLAREKGRVIVVGLFPLEVPRKLYFEKELTLALSRAFGAGSFDPDYVERARDYPHSYVPWTAGRHLEEFLALLARDRARVDPLITHRFPIERASDAYRLLENARPSAGGARPLGILFTYEIEKPLTRAVAGDRPVPSATPPTIKEPREARQTIHLGVIGCGKFAQTYLLPHLRRPTVCLLSVATGTAPAAAHAQRKFRFQEAGCDARAVIEDPRADSLLIATRHDLHASLAAAGLRAGKTVFVEKPLALNEEELRRIAAAARETGGRLQVGFNRRFSRHGRRAREFFARRQGPLVMTYRVNAAPLPAHHWVYDPREGGGRLRSEVCHFIDFLQFLAGAPPVRVYAEPATSSASAARPEENLHLTLRFADGSTGAITYTTVGDPHVARERIEIFGDRAAVRINNFRTADFHRGHYVRPYWLLQQDMGYRDEMKAFVQAASTGGPMPVPLDELLAASLATLRALDSLNAGAPVDVDFSSLDSSHD